MAFLGTRAEQLESLRHHLPALLQTADDDKDEWVQVVSGLVRRKLLKEVGDSADFGEGATITEDHNVYSTTVLQKTVTEVLERAEGIMLERDGGGGSVEIRSVRKTSYFGPFEEHYVSRKQQPPREEFANTHFSAKYDFINEFSEDLASNVGTASNASSPTGGAVANTAALGFRVGQGGLLKPPPGALTPQPASAGPNLAQARRVSLAATDPAAGWDGRRRTSKPLALARNHGGLQSSATGTHFGSRKSGAVSGGGRGVRGGGGGGSKAGLMMINTDELQAIDAEKQSARKKARGKPGRKKAKVEGSDEQTAAGVEPSGKTASADAQLTNLPIIGDSSTDRRTQEGKVGERKPAESEAPAKPLAQPDVPMPIPQQGEIEAMAAMMVLGVAGGDEEAETSYLPEALIKLLENANLLRAEGKAKLERFFQKKKPEGSNQERIKYHEEVNPGENGESMRVTSYIRLDYETWVWDRIHKKKRVKL